MSTAVNMPAIHDNFGLDTEELLEVAPLVMLYGPPKVGKTTSAMQAFNDALYIGSSPTGLRGYASWYDYKLATEGPDAVAYYRAPRGAWHEGGIARRTLTEYLDDGVTLSDNWTWFRLFFETKYIPNVTLSPDHPDHWPFRGVIIDEFSTFLRRILVNMQDSDDFKVDKGGRKIINNFAIYPALKKFVAWLAQVVRVTKLPVVLICHEQPPKYDEEKGSRTFGQLKYKGGPNMPIGALIEQVCAECDVILRAMLEEPKLDLMGDGSSTNGGPTAAPGEPLIRKFITLPSPEWVGGMRASGVLPEENLNLLSLLERVGFKLR